MVDRNPVFPLVQIHFIAPTRTMLLYPFPGRLGFNLGHGKQAHCRSISPPRISTIKGCTKCETGSRRTYLETLCSKRQIKKTPSFNSTCRYASELISVAAYIAAWGARLKVLTWRRPPGLGPQPFLDAHRRSHFHQGDVHAPIALCRTPASKRYVPTVSLRLPRVARPTLT